MKTDHHRKPPLFRLTMLAGLALIQLACAEPRNLVIVSVDTLRTDAVALVDTPNIDRLALAGTTFDHAFAPIPRTTPALASLLTGLEPGRHGSREVGDPIGDGITTLAEILRGHGYLTIAVSANLSAGRGQGLDRGFDHFIGYDDLIEITEEGIYRDLTDVPPDAPSWAEALTDQALKLLDTHANGQPYFLWLFYFDPHFMYRPPSPWQDEVDGEACWQLYRDFTPRRHQAGQIFFNVGGVAEIASEACRRLYDAEVAVTDHHIGRVLDQLESRGELTSSVVVFTADHGENFGEDGLWFEHGDNAHDAGLSVPLVFAGPGIAAGRRTPQAAALADLPPTLLSLLGLDQPVELVFDGIDLGPWLGPDPPTVDDRILFAESATPIWNEATSHVITGRRWGRVCINDSRYTLCADPKHHLGDRWLYDHVADPGLEHDVATEHPTVVAELSEAWKRWPPETARERVARTTRFKLVHRPRLNGGYSATLYDLDTDPAEAADVKDRFPEEFRRLSEALEVWSASLPPLGNRVFDPEVEAMLRELGYIG